MFITSIKAIDNYRNLNGVTLSFDPHMNFFVGENNVGKTNILELINILLSNGKFKDSDFYDITRPISVIFVISYSMSEIGFFEDYFDVDDTYKITVKAIQETVDDRIIYYHDEAGDVEIPSHIIRRINCLYYYAQRMPSNEIDFRKTNGSGRALNYMIQKSLEGLGVKEKDILKKTKLKRIVKEVNGHINNLNSITGDSLQAYYDEDSDDLICRLLGLGDGSGHSLDSLGEGIQFAFNIILQIIELICKVKLNYTNDIFKERLLWIDQKKYFPIVLILDEPEVHQHPYRQRNLIKKINDVIENKNIYFNQLLKELFEIDGLCGQLFVATHSPNILLNDYHEFIRIYKSKSNQVIAISGSNITLNAPLYKHMLHNFIYLKEAMFSRGIIFVEGDTENGAIPVFARRMDIDLDANGIGVVKLDGADSVLKCMELYKCFGIACIALIDNDKKSEYGNKKDIFFTKQMDFEADVYCNFKLKDYLSCCKELEMLNSWINPLKKQGLISDVPAFLKNPENIIVDDKTSKELLDSNKEEQLQKLKSSKNAYKGTILAEYVTTIPTAFKKAITTINAEVHACR